MSNELQFLADSENDGLAERLRQGAQRERPAFSEELHSRIMLAIRSAEPRAVHPALGSPARIEPAIAAVAPEPVGLASRSSGSEWRHSKILSWTALAAALLVMAVGGLRLSGLGSTATDSQMVQMGVPSVPSSDGTYTWADLDHDARLTAQLVADQMPFETPYEDLNLPNQQ